MDVRRLLVASGDQELFEQISNIVDGRGFSVHAAYSHGDAEYHLRNENFALAIIDGRLTEPASGERSIRLLFQNHPRPPLVVYSDRVDSYADTADAEINSLNPDSLRDALLDALRIPKYEPQVSISKSNLPSSELNGNTATYWHDDEMRTLFALSRSLTEVLELSEVLNRVVEAARRLTNADEGMILLPEEHSPQLYLRAKVGIDAQVAENFRIKTQDTLAGNVYTNAQPVLVNSKGPQKVKTEYFVNSLLYVPILLNAQPLGVLGVNNRQKQDAFSQRHLELLSSLASYAAIAINNARIHGESVRRTHELKALVDASQAVNASLSLEKTMLAVCEHLSQIVNVQCAELYDILPEHRLLYRRASYVQARWRAGAEPTITLSPEDTSVLSAGSIVQINADSPQDQYQYELLQRVFASIALILPVVHGETLFGVLIAYRSTPYKKTPSRNRLQRTLQSLSDHAQVLVGGTSERTTLAAFSALADFQRLLEADRVEFGVAPQAGEALRMRYAYGGMVWFGESFTVPYQSETGTKFEENYTFSYSHDDDALPESIRHLMDATNSHAMLGLPVRMRGQLQGLVVMGDALRSRGFARREIDLARAVVGQAGTAMDNAQLVIDLESSLRELKATQEKLIQSARLSAMGELAAAVAHQINNPLTTIVLDAELLLDGQKPGTVLFDSLSAILRAGKRASSVVRRLLSSARPDTQNAPPVPVDVLVTIQETVALVLPYFERSAMHLFIDVPETRLPPVQAPPGALDDVWLNLLLNAHDVLVGHENPTVNVSVGYVPKDNVVQVIVADNGPGIPDAIRPMIFEPFFTTKPHGEGTGLGLYICRQVIERVDGQISVERNKNGGASFVVRLPSVS